MIEEDFPALPGSSGSSKLDHSSSISLGSVGSSNSLFGLDILGSGGDKASAVGAVGSLRSGVSALSGHSNNTSAADAGPSPVSSGILGTTPGGSGLLANLGLATSTPASQTAMSKEMKFGLAGLLEIIRSTDKVKDISRLDSARCDDNHVVVMMITG